MNIAIVGNGQIHPRQFDQIEKADFIIRFNHPPQIHEYTAMRTDMLVISNSSKQTQKLLGSEKYLTGPVFAGARTIFLPYHPDIISRYMPKPNIFSWMKGRRADLTSLCKRAAHANGKSIDILDSNSYLEVCNHLGIMHNHRCSIFPSSGILLIFHSLKMNPSVGLVIRLYGFGFAGWKGHNWQAEKNYVNKLISEDRVILLN